MHIALHRLSRLNLKIDMCMNIHIYLIKIKKYQYIWYIERFGGRKGMLKCILTF